MSNIVKIKNKFYDFGTKNASFLLTAKELKELGIKTWYQCLEVKYPELGVQDLDPYDPNLSAEDYSRILKECKDNPWFFFREVTRIPVRGVGSLPLYLHRAGHAAIWCFLHSIDFELVQPRQTYKTTVITAIMSYAMLFEYQNANIPYMHQTEKRCEENIEILRDYIYELPKYMNPWANQKRPPGTHSLSYDAHKVGISVMTAKKRESDAANTTRGYSLFIWFIDECEFIPFMKEVINGANPTIVQARITAKQMGVHSCLMYASTPGNLETDEGRNWQQILDNLPVFTESFYDKTDEELEFMKSVPKPDEDRKAITMVYIEFNHVQLRKDAEWLRQQYYEAKQKNTIDEYRRGVLLQRYRGDGTVLFKQEDIDYIVEHVREPDYKIKLLGKYDLYVYKHPINNIDMTSQYQYFDTQIPYLIGNDIAAGGDGDNTTFVIVHPYTLQVVGELMSPYIGALDHMRLVTSLAKLIPRGIFCPETNSIGKTFVDFVQESSLEARIYHDPQLDISKNAIRKDDPIEVVMKRKAKQKQYIGTYVTPTVRKNMIDLLIRQVADYRHLLNTKYLVEDIVNLVRKKNGKVEAADGCHDDMVMGYLHALYVLTYGKDLTRFGINKELCSFEKVYDVLKQYEVELQEDTVNNMIPYENKNAFENQLLYDLTNDTSEMFSNPGGVDEYGYRHDQYIGSMAQSTVIKPDETVSRLSGADYASLMSINNILM
jgi:hypothetical protein